MEISQSLFYAIVFYAVIGAMFSGYVVSNWAWKIGEHISAKRELTKLQLNQLKSGK